jgi:hypothetical protein
MASNAYAIADAATARAKIAPSNQAEDYRKCARSVTEAATKISKSCDELVEAVCIAEDASVDFRRGSKTFDEAKKTIAESLRVSLVTIAGNAELEAEIRRAGETVGYPVK